MNEKTTIRFVLTGVKYSQSDLGKHYKTFCGLYIEIVDFVAFRLSVVLESQRCVRDSNP